MEAPNGDLYLTRSSVGGGVLIEQPDENDRRLIDALDGRHTEADLEDEFGSEEVASVIHQLSQEGMLEDAADDELVEPEVIARFDRQLRYFSDVSTGPMPSECQRKLENARVAVLGVGGLGGWSALALSCCGIGEMLVVDSDRVELTNLNRQVLYGESDIDRPKAEAAAERLASFNSRTQLEVLSTRLESEAEIAAAIDGSDIVIDAIDWPAQDIERWVNGACFAAGIPFLSMSHSPPIARVGPFYLPGTTGCYACQEIAYRREYELFDVVVEHLRGKQSPAATLGPACGLIGSQVALDVMHYLTDLCEPSTLGVAHIYDLRTMQQTRHLVTPEAGCPVCADLDHVSPRPA